MMRIGMSDSRGRTTGGSLAAGASLAAATAGGAGLLASGIVHESSSPEDGVSGVDPLCSDGGALPGDAESPDNSGDLPGGVERTSDGGMIRRGDPFGEDGGAEGWDLGRISSATPASSDSHSAKGSAAP
jgi:hypothetical protein